MNRPRKPIPWNKIFAIVLFACMIGYVLARPTLERWWGVSLPSLTENLETTQTETSAADSAPRDNPPIEVTSNSKSKRLEPQDSLKETAQPTSSNSTTKSDPFSVPATNKPTTAPKTAASKFELKKLDKGRLETPAGLVYSPGPQGEHRVEHVMRHAKDEPSRQQHGVFNGSRDEILKLIDEAFQMIKQNSRQVSKQSDGNRTEYTIRFDRAIGYEGGRSGMKNNFPKVNRLRLVLEDGKYVVTAYPVK